MFVGDFKGFDVIRRTVKPIAMSREHGTIVNVLLVP